MKIESTIELLNSGTLSFREGTFVKDPLVRRIYKQFDKKLRLREGEKVLTEISKLIHTEGSSAPHLAIDLGNRAIEHYKGEAHYHSILRELDLKVSPFRNSLEKEPLHFEGTKSQLAHWESYGFSEKDFYRFPDLARSFFMDKIEPRLKLGNSDVQVIDNEPAILIEGRYIKAGQLRNDFEFRFCMEREKMVLFQKSTEEIYLYEGSGKGFTAQVRKEGETRKGKEEKSSLALDQEKLLSAILPEWAHFILSEGIDVPHSPLILGESGRETVHTFLESQPQTHLIMLKTKIEKVWRTFKFRVAWLLFLIPARIANRINHISYFPKLNKEQLLIKNHIKSYTKDKLALKDLWKKVIVPEKGERPLIEGLKDSEREILRCFLKDHTFKEILGGANVKISNSNLYNSWKGMEGVRARSSSHNYIEGTSYAISTQVFGEFLFWLDKEDGSLRVQLEKSPFGTLRFFFPHVRDYFLYRSTDKQVGPFGLSSYTEHRPIHYQTL